MNKKLLEAALFISSRPLTVNELGRVVGISSLGTVKKMLEELQGEYSSGIEIVETGEGWQMQVRQELLPKVAHLTPYSDLSEGCKRTLALVVYKEPARQAEIVKIQGNKAYSYIKELKRRGLIRAEKNGKTMVLKLTQEFENYFGEEKERLRERMIREMEKAAPKKMKVEKAEEEAVAAETQTPEKEEKADESDSPAETPEKATAGKEKPEKVESDGKKERDKPKDKLKERKPIPSDDENEYLIKF
jgi:segregation and condensation protein B